MSIDEMLDEAEAAFAAGDLNFAGCWLREIEPEFQFTTGSQRRRFFANVDKLHNARHTLTTSRDQSELSYA